MGRHSLDSAKTCSKSFLKFGGDFPINLEFSDHLLPFMKLCRVHRCCMDPAKSSSNLIVS